jgi:hypothetical protein
LPGYRADEDAAKMLGQHHPRAIAFALGAFLTGIAGARMLTFVHRAESLQNRRTLQASWRPPGARDYRRPVVAACSSGQSRPF